MTKKDYVLIAKALRETRATIDDAVDHGEDVTASSGVSFAAGKLAYYLAIDNPRFDKDRFINATIDENIKQ